MRKISADFHQKGYQTGNPGIPVRSAREKPALPV
jgi:hypothetical protein